MRTTAIIGFVCACMAFGVVSYPTVQAVQDEPVQTERIETPLAALTFLTGTWRGKMNGEFVEEIWSTEQGGAMMGMFRWLGANGQPRMYELLTISREEEATFLRLRHFNSKMVAWEEKDSPVVLRLTESTPGRAIFTNVNEEDRMKRITFNQPQKGELEINVDFGEAREALAFRFDRAQ